MYINSYAIICKRGAKIKNYDGEARALSKRVFILLKNPMRRCVMGSRRRAKNGAMASAMSICMGEDSLLITAAVRNVFQKDGRFSSVELGFSLGSIFTLNPYERAIPTRSIRNMYKVVMRAKKDTP